jgi:ariadne-1
LSLLAGIRFQAILNMASDYEFSDDDAEYYDEDEEMIDGTQDGRTSSFSPRFLSDISYPEQSDDEDMGSYVPPKSKRKPYELDYESLSQSAVEKLMQEDVDHICGILGVDVSSYVSYCATS